jgi:hypothetical protein
MLREWVRTRTHSGSKAGSQLGIVFSVDEDAIGGVISGKSGHQSLGMKRSNGPNNLSAPFLPLSQLIG